MPRTWRPMDELVEAEAVEAAAAVGAVEVEVEAV
jgi:hypothetical protein